MSKICVSIAENTVIGCLRALGGLELAEVRIDQLESSETVRLREIFSQPVRLIATCRPGRFPTQQRSQLLTEAIQSGAAYIDLELEENPTFRHPITEKARKYDCGVIISHHNDQETPNPAELQKLVERCFQAGAHIAKIACMANVQSDNVRLLSLLQDPRPLIVIGMGEMGRITRVAAPFLGSRWSYVSAGEGKNTAEGQYSKKKLEAIYELIREN